MYQVKFLLILGKSTIATMSRQSFLLIWISNHAGTTCKGCRLFHDDLNQIGIAPAAAEINDVLCKVLVMHTLCILRSLSEGAWRLISGQSYSSRVPDSAMDTTEEGVIRQYFKRLEWISTTLSNSNFVK